MGLRGSRFRRWAVIAIGILLLLLLVYLLGTNNSFNGTNSTSSGNTETINSLASSSSIYMPLPPISSSPASKPPQMLLVIGPLILVVTAAVLAVLSWKRRKEIDRVNQIGRNSLLSASVEPEGGYCERLYGKLNVYLPVSLFFSNSFIRLSWNS